MRALRLEDVHHVLTRDLTLYRVEVQGGASPSERTAWCRVRIWEPCEAIDVDPIAVVAVSRIGLHAESEAAFAAIVAAWGACGKLDEGGEVWLDLPETWP